MYDSEQNHAESDIHSITSFNIMGNLGGVGRPILLQAIHEMDDVRDIRTVLCLSRCTHEAMFDVLFPWSIARGLSKSHSLSSIPIELTDAVCIFLYLSLRLLCILPFS